MEYMYKIYKKLWNTCIKSIKKTMEYMYKIYKKLWNTCIKSIKNYGIHV